MSPAPDAVDESLFNRKNGAKPLFCHLPGARRLDALFDEFRRPHLDVERDLIANLGPFIWPEDAPQRLPAWLVHAGCSEAWRTLAIAVANRDQVADSARNWARPAVVS